MNIVLIQLIVYNDTTVIIMVTLCAVLKLPFSLKFFIVILVFYWNLVEFRAKIRRRKWVRRGRARGPNTLASCRFGAAVFKYASSLF